jgi:hypothetical protein
MLAQQPPRMLRERKGAGEHASPYGALWQVTQPQQPQMVMAYPPPQVVMQPVVVQTV